MALFVAWTLAAVTIRSETLEDLDVGRCRLMQRAHVACKALCKLRLGECDSLKELTLSSEAFRSLHLGTCARLERLTLHAPHVHSLDLTGGAVQVQSRLPIARKAPGFNPCAYEVKTRFKIRLV